jgi:hypothetical protein
VLRDEPVWPSESTNELLSLAKTTRGDSVLFLGNTDYAEWLFDESHMSALAPTTLSLDEATARPTKPANYGTAIDFDSVNPPDLNKFDWVVTTNTAYASQAPAAFRRVRRLPLYELWKRVGTAVPRAILEPSGAPGAVLDCHTRAGRQLMHSHGVAAVMANPVLPKLLPTVVPPGSSIRIGLGRLQGLFELSIQYLSAVDLQIEVGARRFHMPAYLDRPGPWFAAGIFIAPHTPTVVTIKADPAPAIAGPDLNAAIYGVVATPYPATRTVVPLARACGRYVDWYRLS